MSMTLCVVWMMVAGPAAGADQVADNAGISAGSMKDYFDEVRSKYESRTEWFDLDLPWAKRDAMEVSVVPK
ncbi:MAG TPA: hypothetical protein VMY42_03610 [Thermoguttaceae bacterium]|nr:hypothetical protein [Thermoguttaceae bacterium]